MPDIQDLSAAELSAAYATRDLSPVEATQAVLAHIQRWEPHLCATYALDAEGAVWKLVKGEDGIQSVKRVAVKKGRSIGELVELQGEGLSSGDRLVAAPQGLRDGQKVTVAEK